MKESAVAACCVTVLMLAGAAKAATLAHVIETAREGGRLARLPDVPMVEWPPSTIEASYSFVPATETLSDVVYVSASTVYQEIVGFGGAFTEAAAVSLAAMPRAMRQEVLEAYFGDNGQAYDLCRVHMGSCDYCEASYSEDALPGDFELKNFSIHHDEKSGLLQLIRDAGVVARAAGRQPCKVFATPWSPPAWMKRNGAMDNSDGPLGLKSGDQYLRTWALYFSKFITAYSSAGVNIVMITTQNEPTNWPTSWESCAFDAGLQTQFVRDFLGPRLRQDHPHVAILMLDDNKDLLVNWTDTLYADPDAAQFVAGAGVHWYSGDHFDAVSRTRSKWPDKIVIATEACAYPGVVLGEWARGEWYGHDMIGDLAAGAAGWVDWNLALGTKNCTRSSDQQPCVSGPNHADPQGDDSPVIVDTVLHKVHYQIPFYYMGQITRFVPPGAYRIEHRTASSLEVVAFFVPVGGRVNGTVVTVAQVVVVVMNRREVAVAFTLVYEDGGIGAAVSIPAHAIQTYWWDA